jgi:hypothetical protein
MIIMMVGKVSSLPFEDSKGLIIQHQTIISVSTQTITCPTCPYCQFVIPTMNEKLKGEKEKGYNHHKFKFTWL